MARSRYAEFYRADSWREQGNTERVEGKVNGRLLRTFVPGASGFHYI